MTRWTLMSVGTRSIDQLGAHAAARESGSGRERFRPCHWKTVKTRRGHRGPLLLALFVRMTVRGRGVFVGSLAMFLSRARVLLGFFMFANSVVMLGLMMMVRSRVVVSGRQVMMLGSRMLR
jgi:hypothetical protein